jgi:hypothetical protein
LSGRARLSGVRGAWNEYPVICICRCSIWRRLERAFLTC